MFWAERGAGAFLNEKRLRVSARREFATALFATGIPFAAVSAQRRLAFARTLGTLMPQVAGIRRFGAAALDLAWVAAGRYDGYWELGLKPWDMAAGILIVREAGGFVTDAAGRRKPGAGQRRQRRRRRQPAHAQAAARSGGAGCPGRRGPRRLMRTLAPAIALGLRPGRGRASCRGAGDGQPGRAGPAAATPGAAPAGRTRQARGPRCTAVQGSGTPGRSRQAGRPICPGAPRPAVRRRGQAGPADGGAGRCRAAAPLAGAAAPHPGRAHGAGGRRRPGLRVAVRRRPAGHVRPGPPGAEPRTPRTRCRRWRGDCAPRRSRSPSTPTPPAPPRTRPPPGACRWPARWRRARC